MSKAPNSETRLRKSSLKFCRCLNCQLMLALELGADAVICPGRKLLDTDAIKLIESVK